MVAVHVEPVATTAGEGSSIIVVVVVVVVRTDGGRVSGIAGIAGIGIAGVGRIGGIGWVWIVGVVATVNLEGYVGGCQYSTVVLIVILPIIGGVVSVVVNGYGDLYSVSLD